MQASLFTFSLEVLNDFLRTSFLAVVLFGSSPPPLPATHRKTEKKGQLADPVEGGGGGEGS
jgi:hypothetical protein